MKALKQLLGKLNGLDYRQEYLCFARESFEKPLYVYIIQNRKAVRDITDDHCFTGYCPVVFALSSSVFAGESPENLLVVFCRRPLEQNEDFNEKDAIALLDLRKISQAGIDEAIASFYEGVQGRHRFISPLHQSVIHLNNRLYGKKPGNVFLEGNLYDQVQIGYCVPRKISLVTVGEMELFNHFPTDLHGQIDSQHYVISLRHEGNACNQVEAAKKIVLSDVSAIAYKKAYSLGKNHMQPLKAKVAFEFSDDSEVFRLPLPKDAIAYKELELTGTFIKGIHKIMLFRIVYSRQVKTDAGTLVHIHNSYATWRNKQHLIGNYLPR